MDSTVDDGRHARLRPASPIAEVTRLGVTTAHATLGVGRFLLDTAFDAAHLRAPSGKRAAAEVRATFEHLGPTYVKLGQLIASSPGVFTETLAGEFESLLDRVPPADPAAQGRRAADQPRHPRRRDTGGGTALSKAIPVGSPRRRNPAAGLATDIARLSIDFSPEKKRACL